MADDQNPWGKRPEQGPPDLLELLKKFFSGAKKAATSAASSPGNPISHLPAGKWIGLGVGLFFLIWLLAGVFVVKPAEQAVILRLGKYVGTVGAGPHWIPALIEKRFVINTQEVRNFPYRAEMLTMDENIVSVAVAVQYRIADPEAFLFNVVQPVRSLQQATSSALRQVVGQMTLDDILTKGRQTLRDGIASQLNDILKIYNTGLEVTDLTLQPAKPPEDVTAAFDDAIKAREDEQRYINQAQAYVRQVTSTATGQIARLTQSAKAYQQEVVLRAQGQTARFLALLRAYQQAPVVTRERLYLEGVQSVLMRTRNVIVDAAQNNMMVLPLDQILKRGEGSQLTNKPVEESPATTISTSSPSSTSSSSDSGDDRPSYPQGANS